MPETVNKNKAGIDSALKVLKRGGTIVFPTETLYGLGAVSTNREAVKKIYRIKKRQTDKLLPVVVGSFEQAADYFILSHSELKLAKKFWPGPLSIILKTKSKELKESLGNELLAVRFSADPLAAKLAESLGAPLISTSANISGKPGCFTVAAVKRQLSGPAGSDKPDLFLDGGMLEKSPPSTIVRMHGNKLSVVREGKISTAQITEALKS